jgi:hypothetical protein
MSKLTSVGAFIVADPPRARAAILDALQQAQGNRPNAARILCADVRTLYRWIDRLELWPEVDGLGFEVPEGGRPRGPMTPKS